MLIRQLFYDVTQIITYRWLPRYRQPSSYASNGQPQYAVTEAIGGYSDTPNAATATTRTKLPLPKPVIRVIV